MRWALFGLSVELMCIEHMPPLSRMRLMVQCFVPTALFRQLSGEILIRVVNLAKTALAPKFTHQRPQHMPWDLSKTCPLKASARTRAGNCAVPHRVQFGSARAAPWPPGHAASTIEMNRASAPRRTRRVLMSNLLAWARIFRA